MIKKGLLASKMLWEKGRRVIIPAIVSLFSSWLILYPINPNNNTIPSRDSGVFLYMGWRILKGEIPYRDIWDHKPPLIYFTNAIGLWLTPHSMWGVWIIQFIFIALTTFFVYKAIQEYFGNSPALFGSIALTSALLSVLERGNVTEEYALPFQAFAFWWGIKAHKKGFPLLDTFIIGIAGGIAFYYKQTTIGVWLAFGSMLILYRLLQKEGKQIVKDILALGSGTFIFSCLFALYFFIHNSLADFWELAFKYNFLYIKKGEFPADLLRVFDKGYAFLSNGWIIQFTAISIFLIILYLSHNNKLLFREKNFFF